MSREFVVVIVNHRKLGELLQPYMIEKRSDQSFFQLTELLILDDLNSNNYSFSDIQKKIIKCAGNYSEKTIHKLFSKKKNLKDFFNTLEDEYFVKQIRPYIEKHLCNCLDIIVQSDVAVYVKEKNYQVIHEDDVINTIKEPVHPVFNFVKTSEDFRYFLSIRHNEKDIKLTDQEVTILTNKPCNILLGKSLYKVEDIDSKKLLPFFTKDHIVVPKAREKDYAETFVRNAIMNYQVKTVGIKIQELNTEKQAILALENDLQELPVFILRFKYGEQVFPYGSTLNMAVTVSTENDGYIFSKIIRDAEWEGEKLLALGKLGFKFSESSAFIISGLDQEKKENTWFNTVNWLNLNKGKLLQNGFEFSRVKGGKDYYTGKIDLGFQINAINDWFDIQATVDVGEFTFPFVRFRKHIIMGVREFTLPNNQVMVLPEEWFSKFREIFVFGDQDKDKIRLKKHHFQVIKEAIGNETNEFISELAEKFDLSNAHLFTVPQMLQATLREYQKTGAYWMYQLYKNRLGGVLADDMGLGKTLQAITLLLKIKDEISLNNHKGGLTKTQTQLSLFDIPAFTGTGTIITSLIVMPVSLIHNWEAEINKFAPLLKIHKYQGTQRTKNVNDLFLADVVLTSYGIVRNEIDLLKQVNFKYIILDESQTIKNPESKIYKAVTQLQSDYKLVLTGTPIENSLIDLWAQLNFLNRDFLKSQHYFREEFVVPIEKQNDLEKQKKLQILINPFILRRKKEEVVKELPSLTEQTIYCEMTDEQYSLYEEEKSKIRNLIFDNIEKQGVEKSSIIILKGLNQLRLLANHPVLAFPDYCSDSGKFEEIMRSIENVVEENHKVLIFSSYVKHLNLVSTYLKEKNWNYSILTGATRDRARVINDFQLNADNRIFLISLKAGGTGLNLTAADYVFILDPWWNPAAENQAISRAHRIGQDKKVFVYRFLSSNTIEEKINLLQQKKSAMADLFINSNNPFKAIGRQEIEELFS